MPAPRVCFVTCLRWPEISASDRLVQDALERRGVVVAARAWNDPAARFDGFDTVVLRSNWDYHWEVERFLGWLDGVEQAGAAIWNPPALVRWNVSKRYLLALEAAGVPVVPSLVLGEGTPPARLPALLASRGWPRAVVKPLVSASAHDTVLVTREEAPAVARALEAGEIRGPALVQPFVEEIRSGGEWSLVFIDGVLTHAVLKRPAAGEFRVQLRFGGTAEACAPPPDVAAAAARAMAALPVPPLYARVDGVATGPGFLIMELELNEPGLFFVQAPEAAARLAEAICRRLPIDPPPSGAGTRRE
ncbi:MAG: hypothetical protein L0027_00275 [Candidatus Rokubacteria bacterium]|nr:hypothetical protein [Candidatus Rokubacteria bacterium]